ncbi:MAG: cytochrome c oxidase subunit II [Gemmatimonadales bacterium]|jgi:cytochrome c oxidase subunit 2
MSMFSDASDAAASVSRIGWLLIVLSAIVFVVVMALMVAGVLRNRDRSASSVDLEDKGVGWLVWGGAVFPGVILVGIFVVSMTAMGRFPARNPVVTIHVVGHQWWWEADYEFPDRNVRFRTANEIHIPVGRPTRLLLTSADVIHSFWVPRLQGKLDLIPGDTNDLRLVAKRAGRFTGACAEFCGAQHANMGIIVVAEDSTTFAQWVAAQLAPGAEPTDSVTALGQRLFIGGPCALCHTVRGTPAEAQVAPDLTHIGSRSTIAAGTLPNTLGNLEGWIVNAQSLKPGVKMPTITAYSGHELRALAMYVASLK